MHLPLGEPRVSQVRISDKCGDIDRVASLVEAPRGAGINLKWDQAAKAGNWQFELGLVRCSSEGREGQTC